LRGDTGLSPAGRCSDREIQDVLDEGVELKLNTAFGKDVTLPQLKKMASKLLFLQSVLKAEVNLELRGRLRSVVDCIEFLRDVNGDRSKVKVGNMSRWLAEETVQ